MKDETADKLIQPILDNENELTAFILSIFGSRINDIYDLPREKLRGLIEYGRTAADLHKIQLAIKRIRKIQMRNLARLAELAAIDSYIIARGFFEFAGEAFIPYAQNAEIVDMIDALKAQVLTEYAKTLQTPMMTVPDATNPKIIHTMTVDQAYKETVERATEAREFTDNPTVMAQQMRPTVERLVFGGVRPSTQNARREVVVQHIAEDTVRAAAQAVQDKIGEKFGADGKELSAHPFSAPDHEPFQGLQFTNEEFDKLQSNENFESLDGQKFFGVDRVIGQYNCRHVAWSIKIGYSPPNYSPEQLQQWREENKKGVTLPNGKHLTMYECTQEQRRMEREIRRAEEQQMTAKNVGDEVATQKWKSRRAALKKEYAEFSKFVGLSQKPDRLTASGYQRLREIKQDVSQLGQIQL